MEPTILPGDRVLVLKCAYQIRIPFSSLRLFRTGTPRRGELVVIRNPDGKTVPFIQRLVGLPGDVLEMRNETLFINGRAQTMELGPEVKTADGENVSVGKESLEEHVHQVSVHPQRPAFRTFGPITVPLGEVFLLGDNRDLSRDSRFYGTRSISDLLGRVMKVFWSVDPEGNYRSGRSFAELR